MEPSVLNRPCRFFFLLALLLLLHGVAEAAKRDNSGPAAPEDSQGSAGNQSALDLALKAIILSQGEGGFERWRLKAEWANMQKRDDIIFLIKPRLTYFMEDGNVIYIQSDGGNVEQQKQMLRFIDNVRATRDDKILTGKLLVYNGTAKTMTMPESAELTAAEVWGSANHLVWFIDTKRIETRGDVIMHLDSPAPEGHTPPGAETAR
jgi:LPS export ABC transporter protein LptC